MVVDREERLADRVRRLLSEAAPPVALERACAGLADTVGGRVGCWLVDYHESLLVCVDDGEELPLDRGGDVARAFASGRVEQTGLAEGSRVVLPLLTRGERLGVLEATLPQAPPDRLLDELGEAADAIAGSLRGLDHLTDHYEQLRRARPMTLSADLQWALLPARSYQEPGLAVAGLLEPAYSVAGDAFDHARQPDVLDLAVFDGAGQGVAAALATGLAVQAVRNARRAGLGPADQATLADQALHSHYGGESAVSGLVIRLVLATGALRVVDAGSPLLFRVRGPDVQEVDLDRQLPLGMFEDSVYEEQELTLGVGDRLVVVSDGMHAAAGPDHRAFGEEMLARGLRDGRLLPAPELVRHLVRRLHEYLGGAPLRDDAVVVCLDWRPVQPG